MPCLGQAYESVPFYSRDANPFIQVFGLPPMEDPHLNPAGGLSTRFSLDVANNAQSAASPDEAITLDGETYRLSLAMRYGVSDRLELAAELPMLIHSSGSLDAFIKSWHGLLGLSNGDRDRFSNNALRYRYEDTNGVPYDIDAGASGLGDIRLSAAWRILAEPGANPRRVTLRAGLKLPTGEADNLTGSEATDFSLDVSVSDARLFAKHAGAIYGRLGVVFLGQGSVLSERQREQAVYANLGFGRRVSDNLELKLQFDAHSSVYDSGLAQLGGHSIQFTLGGSVVTGKQQFFDLGLTENLTGDTTPDVVFLVSWRRSYP